MSTSNSYKKSNLTIQAEEDEDHEESQGTNSQPSPSIAEYPPKESIASILKKNKDFAEKKSRPVPQSPEKNQAAHMEAPLLTANRESLAQEIPAERNSNAASRTGNLPFLLLSRCCSEQLFRSSYY